MTKGSAPSMSVGVDPATNHMVGYAYDANGNLTSMPLVTMSYDVENRLVQATHSYNGTDQYVYDPANRRVWKQEPTRELIYFYGVDGTLLTTYRQQGQENVNNV